MIKKIISESTAVLTLNRPEKRNAINPEMIKYILESLDEYSSDDKVKSLIITGEGKAFCAGADLEYLSSISKNSLIENRIDSELTARFFTSIYEFQKPVIAAVNGAAIAGGCGLASVCDFIIADKANAKFGYSEVKIGFIPAIVSIFLVKKIGEGKARQMILSGDIINAEEAYRLGLADYLSDDSVNSALELAARLNNNSLLSMKEAKKMIHNISSMNVKDAVNYCIQLNTLSRTTDEFVNGINSFLKK